MRHKLWLMVILILILLPLRVEAQRPGELAGRVAEARTDAPVEMASVEIPELGLRAWTDAAGRFRFRGLEPGPYRVRVTRTGYTAGAATVDVRNGQEAWIAISLAAVAVALDAVTVSGTRDPLTEGTEVARTEIERSGARTAADLVERVPGAVVRATSPAGPRTVSIRGGAPDAVLVLVDGIPLNDPVTGEADLSAVPAATIHRLTVLPGAQSARYGPRAETGVVLIETRAGEVGRAAEASLGTLEERAARGEWGVAAGSAVLQAGGHARSLEGAFRHPRDVRDDSIVRRRNADLEEWSGFAALSARWLGGDLRARGGWDGLERGLPGLGHTPSPQARQEMARGRGSVAWRRAGTQALVSGAVQRVHFSDPDPPFGLPYDDTTRVRMLNARVETQRPGPGPVQTWGAGVEMLAQRVDAALSDRAPRTQTGFGAFAHGAGGLRILSRPATLGVQARADREAVSGDWFLSRAVTLTVDLWPVRLQLANRSAFSPPSLGDQFFRDGVGVEPNPDLRAERIPNEWELGASTAFGVGPAHLSIYATAYDSDVRGMIVWAQRFTNRWSPVNVDAHRRGLDTRADATLAGGALRVSAAYALARITYDRAGDGDDGVQVVYRPRHTGSLGAEWSRGPWRARAATRYTGARNPTPTDANQLPGFWSTELGAARDWRVGRWTMTTAVDVDRALDEKGHLIEGFPEPGRRARLNVRIARTGSPSHNR
jgi:outer membrane cobalamin receptor